MDFAYDLIFKFKEQDKISDICKKNNLHYSNLINHKLKPEQEKIVADEIAKNILYLYRLCGRISIKKVR